MVCTSATVCTNWFKEPSLCSYIPKLRLMFEANYYICSPNNLLIEMGVGKCTGPQPLFKGCLYVEFINIYISTGFISFSLLS